MRVKSLWLLLFAVMASASVLCLTAFNNSDNVVNDPLGQMVVSENILKHHRLSLDNLSPETLEKLTYHVAPAANGRKYYYFPLGTTIMVLPLVGALDVLGWDMLRDEASAEHVACAIAAPILIFMLFIIARHFVTPITAIVLSALMWLGTSLSSVGGLAPWAHLTSTSFATLALLLALRDPAVRSPWLRGALGLALFMAYLSRPTMALLAVTMPIFIVCRSWRAWPSAAWVAGIFAGLLAIFFSVNLYVFGEARPLFYAGDRLGTMTYWTGIYGNLFGPSRGLFVFSPFLLVPLAFVPQILRSDRRALLVLALAWPMLHLAVVADFPRWWAGFSFGPRYTMEVLPGLFLLLCLSWSEARRLKVAVPCAALLAFLGAFAVFAHTFEGMFNTATPAWNGFAAIDEHPELALDWRWPQWAATEARNRDLIVFRRALSPP